MESFGDRLRRLRVAADMTPSALAHEVGVTEGAIRQMESGQTKTAGLVVGLKLAAALGVDVHYLALGEGVTPSSATIASRVAALERKVQNIDKRTRAR